MFLGEHRFGFQRRMNGFRHCPIKGCRRRRFHVGNQMGKFLMTGFRDMHVVASPQNLALRTEAGFPKL